MMQWIKHSLLKKYTEKRLLRMRMQRRVVVGLQAPGFKRGGQFKNKNKKQKYTAKTKNKPVCETSGKAHRTELCWRTT